MHQPAGERAASRKKVLWVAYAGNKQRTYVEASHCSADSTTCCSTRCHHQTIYVHCGMKASPSNFQPHLPCAARTHSLPLNSLASSLHRAICLAVLPIPSLGGGAYLLRPDGPLVVSSPHYTLGPTLLLPLNLSKDVCHPSLLAMRYACSLCITVTLLTLLAWLIW